MDKFTTFLQYNDYINGLMYNQNKTNIDWLQNIKSKKDYDELLLPALRIIMNNPYASLTTLRLKLFEQSGIKEMVDDFVHKTEITPGVILDFGTSKTRDTILCGLSQESIMNEFGQRIDAPKALEENTIFDLASTSKLFTALAIIKLEEIYDIDLFTPIHFIVPQFSHLEDVTIYDLLKFRISVVTDKRIDSAKTPKEAEQILFSVHPAINQDINNAYTDIGAMILRYVVEAISKVSFEEFVEATILNPAHMVDTYLNVPKEKIFRVANENYSSIVKADGSIYTRLNNFPGTVHDPKAVAMGHCKGTAPGHAGWFSTKDDMVKLGEALCLGRIISKKNLFSISDTASGFKENDQYTHCYGSLVYLKQGDSRYLSVYPYLSGKAFMSPGFAGTSLVIDPLNNITLFMAGPRLHNRIYQVASNQLDKIVIDENGKKTFVLPNGEEKVISADYTQKREKMVYLGLRLALQYQLLEKINPSPNQMHLVRELN